MATCETTYLDVCGNKVASWYGDQPAFTSGTTSPPALRMRFLIATIELALRGSGEHEFQSYAIHAIAQTRRFRTIVVYMTEVTTAATAMHFGLQDKERAIFTRAYGIR